MDAQTCYEIVKLLDTDSQGVTQKHLAQSLLACEAGNVELMLELAQTAWQVAWRGRDQLGEAAALFHLGLAYAQMNRLDWAEFAIERARQIYRREPDPRQRYNEGLAVYSLGLIWQQRSVYSPTLKLDVGDSRAASCYQEALELLQQASHSYAIAGNSDRFQAVQRVCDQVYEQSADQLPIIYIEGEAYQPVPPADQAEGSQSGDYLLARWIHGAKGERSSPGVYRLDECAPGQFVRDERGGFYFVDSRLSFIGAADDPQLEE